MDWPSNSPDLNPIENIWGIMSKRLEGQKKARNKKALFQSADRVWKEITDQILINRLIESMPRRMREVIDRKGGHIDY